jgi:hypothetical protein
VIIDGAAGGETKIRHDVTFPLLTLHREKDFSKKKALSIPVSCSFFIGITDEIMRNLLLMHDGKIPSKWVILGQELTENNLRK